MKSTCNEKMLDRRDARERADDSPLLGYFREGRIMVTLVTRFSH